MSASDPSGPPSPDPASAGDGRFFLTLRAALNAGLLVGFLLGLVDGVVAGLRTHTSGLVNWAGCIAAATVFYGLVALVALFLTTPLTHLWLKRRDLGARLSWMTSAALGLGIFFDLYWWTRPFVLWGVPATDPRRLAAAAGMLVAGLVLGVVVVKLGSLLSVKTRWIGSALVPLAFVGGLAYLSTAGADAAERGQPNERNRHMPNVLLFVVDALRQDTIGCYGDERVETPVMDDLAERGVLFENAFVQAPFTWTSFGSILTGKYPRRHGLLKMRPGFRMPQNITLASHLKSGELVNGGKLEDTDYVGATFMTGTLSHGSGLLHGFDTYFEAMVGHPLVEVDNPWSVFKSELVLSRIHMKLLQRVDEAPVANEAVKWFRANGTRRFVAMVHYYSTHTPYDPPQRFRDMYLDPDYDGPIDSFYASSREVIERGDYEPTPADVQRITDLYYAGVSQADHMIGQVLEELGRQKVLDQTLVIVTSDHGEELGDHGLWEHNFMFQTNLRIPLTMTWPGKLPAAKRVGAMVETVDIVPTVCELSGVEPPFDAELEKNKPGAGRIDGVSLMPLIRGEAESVKEFSYAENGLELSIQDRLWKLVVLDDALDSGWRGKAKLYDLTADPDEQANVVAENEAQAQRLFDQLKTWSEAFPIRRDEVIESARDQDQQELSRRMRALGYTEMLDEEEEDR
jgi:arylsulfatase A-like enzyme